MVGDVDPIRASAAFRGPGPGVVGTWCLQFANARRACCAALAPFVPSTSCGWLLGRISMVRDTSRSPPSNSVWMQCRRVVWARPWLGWRGLFVMLDKRAACLWCLDPEAQQHRKNVAAAPRVTCSGEAQYMLGWRWDCMVCDGCAIRRVSLVLTEHPNALLVLVSIKIAHKYLSVHACAWLGMW